MPASNARHRQPVNEIVQELGRLIAVPAFENVLVKASTPVGGAQLKDMKSKEDKAVALQGRFLIKDGIANQGRWNVLLVDDLFDTGALMEAACTVLRGYCKINKVYVTALTWK